MPREEKRTLSIEARVKDFASKTFRGMRRNIQRFTSGAVRALKGLAKTLTSLKTLAVGALAVFGARALAGFVRGTLDSTAALGRWADKLGIGVDELSKLTFAAEQMGLESDVMVEGLKTLQERMDDASRGTATYQEHFADLGLSVVDAEGKLKNVADFLPELSAAYQAAAEGGQEKLILATEDLIGGSEHMLDILLRQGPEAIKAYGDDLERLGGVVTREMVDKALEANQALGRLQAAVGGLSRELLTALAPAIADLADAFADFIADNREEILAFVRWVGEQMLRLLDIITDAIIRFVKLIEDAPVFGGSLVDTSQATAEIETLRGELEKLGTVYGLVKRERDRLTQEEGLSTREAIGAISVGKILKAEGELGDQARKLSADRQAINARIREIQVGIDEGLAGMLAEMKKNFTAGFKSAIQGGRGVPPGGLPIPELPPVVVEATRLDGVKDDTAARQREDILLNLEARMLRLRVPTREVRMEMALLDAAMQENQLRASLEQAGVEGELFAAKMNEGLFLIGENLGRTTAQLEGDFVAGFTEAADVILEKWTDTAQAGAEAAGVLLDQGLSGISDALGDVIAGTKSAKDAFADFARDFLIQIAKMIAKLIVMKTLQTITGQQGGGLTLFAKGGVMPGELKSVQSLPVRSYASGGIARSPQVAIFGEGRTRGEAFVPLPDGRTIPVTLSGGSGPRMEITINAMDAQDVHRVLVRNRHSILGIWSHAASTEVQMRHNVRKAAS